MSFFSSPGNGQLDPATYAVPFVATIVYNNIYCPLTEQTQFLKRDILYNEYSAKAGCLHFRAVTVLKNFIFTTSEAHPIITSKQNSGRPPAVLLKLSFRQKICLANHGTHSKGANAIQHLSNTFHMLIRRQGKSKWTVTDFQHVLKMASCENVQCGDRRSSSNTSLQIAVQIVLSWQHVDMWSKDSSKSNKPKERQNFQI